MAPKSKSFAEPPADAALGALVGLFAARTPEEVAADQAQQLSFRFLSEVERLMGERGLTKRALAAAVGTSASYITQLFRGDRLLNLPMLARLEQALDIRFVLTAEAAATTLQVKRDGEPLAVKVAA